MSKREKFSIQTTNRLILQRQQPSWKYSWQGRKTLVAFLFLSLLKRLRTGVGALWRSVAHTLALSVSPARAGGLWWNNAPANILNPFFNKDTETIEEITNTEPDGRRRKFGLVTSLPTGILQSLHPCMTHDCLLNRLFRRKSQKTSKLRVTGLYEGTGDRWIPRINGQSRGKCFHLMTLSWRNVMYPGAPRL